jgi:hypothetical protein
VVKSFTELVSFVTRGTGSNIRRSKFQTQTNLTWMICNLRSVVLPHNRASEVWRSVRNERHSGAMLRNEGTNTFQGICTDVRAKLWANRKVIPVIAYNTLEQEYACREGAWGDH